MTATSGLSHIAFISRNYPTPWHPYKGVFLRELVRAVARLGIRCTPVHPIQMDRWLRHVVLGGMSVQRVETEDAIRPVYIGASNRRAGPVNTTVLTQAMFQRAALRALHRLSPRPDVLYGHFLYPGGGAAVWCGRRMRLPSFVAIGEGVFWTAKSIGLDRTRCDFQDVTGVIAVSSHLRKKAVTELWIPAHKIGVFPNGVDRTKFFPRDRLATRIKHGFPEDCFLVAFVGNFVHEKGVDRVVRAIEGLDRVKAVFAGSGPIHPSGENIIRAERFPHECIPEILSAADVFVLPTVAEGSSNAIVEAMACGLPVITSIGEFNDDLVDDSMSIRVHPLDVDALRRAIIVLRDNPERRREMAHSSFQRSERFDIARRAHNICHFIAEKASLQVVERNVEPTR